MTDEKNIARAPHVPHSLTLSDRRALSLSGVNEVVSCDEEIVVLRTSMGGLTVTGSKLHIGSFRRETGELTLDGSVKELVYADADTQHQGFFSRLFR